MDHWPRTHTIVPEPRMIRTLVRGDFVVAVIPKRCEGRRGGCILRKTVAPLPQNSPYSLSPLSVVVVRGRVTCVCVIPAVCNLLWLMGPRIVFCKGERAYNVAEHYVRHGMSLSAHVSCGLVEIMLLVTHWLAQWICAGI